MLGVKYDPCSLEGTFEKFSSNGTWNSFQTRDETPSEPTVTFSGNIPHHSGSFSQKITAYFFPCAELNVNVLFSPGHL